MTDDSYEFDDSGYFTIVLMTKKLTHCLEHQKFNEPEG